MRFLINDAADKKQTAVSSSVRFLVPDLTDADVAPLFHSSINDLSVHDETCIHANTQASLFPTVVQTKVQTLVNSC